ncbi:thioredoxin family protein [Nocardia heshunensis]
MTLKSVDDVSFDEAVLKSDVPVAVLFWAEWANLYRPMVSNLEALAAEYGDMIDVVMLNVDQSPMVTARYGVTSYPTLNVYQGGEVVKTIVGGKPKAAIERELSPFIQR